MGNPGLQASGSWARQVWASLGKWAATGNLELQARLGKRAATGNPEFQASLSTSRQVWASGRRREILEFRLWGTGLGKSRQVSGDRKSWNSGYGELGYLGT